MPVDKFGINCDRTTSLYWNKQSKLIVFLRRNGGNIAIRAIDMNSNIIKNVSDSLSNQDVAIKNYVDTTAFTIADGVVSGDIKLNDGSDSARNL